VKAGEGQQQLLELCWPGTPSTLAGLPHGGEPCSVACGGCSSRGGQQVAPGRLGGPLGPGSGGLALGGQLGQQCCVACCPTVSCQHRGGQSQCPGSPQWHAKGSHPSNTHTVVGSSRVVGFDLAMRGHWIKKAGYYFGEEESRETEHTKLFFSLIPLHDNSQNHATKGDSPVLNLSDPKNFKVEHQTSK